MHNFWDIHGFWFVFFMFFFPRLTILFTNIITGGLFWWIGWIFTPRLLVAILATKSYWDTNFFLVILTWIWALNGEKFEKKNIIFKTYNWKISKRKKSFNKNSQTEIKNRNNVIDI